MLLCASKLSSVYCALWKAYLFKKKEDEATIKIKYCKQLSYYEIKLVDKVIIMTKKKWTPIIQATIIRKCSLLMFFLCSQDSMDTYTGCLKSQIHFQNCLRWGMMLHGIAFFYVLGIILKHPFYFCLSMQIMSYLNIWIW